jgi:3-oxoacyl-[acyl-carrier protein] reductase
MTRGTALVTGGARGLGYAAALRLADDGYTVVIADRDAKAAESARATAAADGRELAAVALDVAAADAARVVGDLAASRGGIDVLVNNAGIVRDGPLVDMSDDDFRLVVDVCLFGAFNMCRAVVPLMAEASYGRIINMSSRAYLGNPGQANYSAAKAGIVGLTKALAKELGRSGITVNAIAPGLMDTDMVRQHPKYDAIVERAARANSIPRIGQPDDVAGAVSFLAGSDAGFITGEVLHVSGGRFS